MKTSPPDSSLPHVPSCWYWHYQRLQALRERLLADRDIHIAEASEPLEPHSMDMADSATDEFDHDMALGMLSHEEDALREVDAAIVRIIGGTYGICEVTGKAIPEARLRAVPWTPYTKEVEERLEQECLVRVPHLGPAVSVQGSKPAMLSADEQSAAEDPGNLEAARRRRLRAMNASETGIDLRTGAAQYSPP